MMAEVRDRARISGHPKWFKVIEIRDPGGAPREKELARFGTHGDAYVWALDVSKRPMMQSDYVCHVTLEVRT